MRCQRTGRPIRFLSPGCGWTTMTNTTTRCCPGRTAGSSTPGARTGLAVAEILPDSEIGAVERLIAGKYLFDMIIFRPLRFVQARLYLGRPRTEPAILGIT